MKELKDMTREELEALAAAMGLPVQSNWKDGTIIRKIEKEREQASEALLKFKAESGGPTNSPNPNPLTVNKTNPADDPQGTGDGKEAKATPTPKPIVEEPQDDPMLVTYVGTATEATFFGVKLKLNVETAIPASKRAIFEVKAPGNPALEISEG